MENGDVPAAKQEIGRLDQTIEQFRAELNHYHNDLAERITSSSARILKAFYNIAESSNKRLTQIEDDGAAIRSRLATLNDRLLEVEKRLNMPPTR
jgi:chromosome segregation ATPase